MTSAGSHTDWFSGTAAAATGFGVLTFAFFPFALPLLILTIAAALPLVLPLLVVAAVAMILKGTRLGIRAAGRGIRGLQPSQARRGHTPAYGSGR
jgi:hypothetical protein